MVLGALEAKTVWTKSKARFFQIFDLQSSIIFKAKNCPVLNRMKNKGIGGTWER